MKLNISRKWFLLLITVVLPVILMTVAALLEANVCVFMGILMWVGMIAIVAFIPYFKE